MSSRKKLPVSDSTKPSQSAKGVAQVSSKGNSVESEELIFAREYWTGASRDGVLEDGDGYHYYRMTKSGKILEAYECYELDDGRECAAPLPEMLNVDWIKDLGFEDFEALDMIKEIEFSRIKDIASGIDRS